MHRLLSMKFRPLDLAAFGKSQSLLCLILITGAERKMQLEHITQGVGGRGEK
jgi:hypothetical protein